MVNVVFKDGHRGLYKLRDANDEDWYVERVVGGQLTMVRVFTIDGRTWREF